MNKIFLLFNTVKYLKLSQVYFQIINKLKPKRSLKAYNSPNFINIKELNFLKFSTQSFANENNIFIFLNLEKNFDKIIDWNFLEFGKLWNYNLQYLNCLNQDNLSDDYKIKLLTDINDNLYSGNLALEPYPTSLRIINSIRFLNTIIKSKNNEYNNSLFKAVYAQADYLFNNLEYHILGNHLLENAFALLVSAEFYDNNIWREKASKILYKELNEQILNDGAHFELSPMYHQIIFSRLLESIPIVSDIPLKYFLIEKASKMYGWLKLITFKNGDIPHFNDSTDNITYKSEELFTLANSIGINANELTQFTESGYRRFQNDNIEIIIDVNGISPSYQPGHAHADHLSFVLNYLGEPVIVDPSISTYNISKRRDWERSSLAHNTVTINNSNQSQVWGGFRVAKRAEIYSIKEKSNLVEASLKYSLNGKLVLHTRTLEFNNDIIYFYDLVDYNSNSSCIARYYLHPSVNILNITDKIYNINNLQFSFENADNIILNDYKYSMEFNKLVDAKVIVVEFNNKLKLQITSKL